MFLNVMKILIKKFVNVLCKSLFEFFFIANKKKLDAWTQVLTEDVQLFIEIINQRSEKIDIK